MLNKTKRIFAVLLAVALVFSLVGCSKTNEEQSSGYEIVYDEEIVYENAGGSGGSGGGSSNNPDTSTDPSTSVTPGDTINADVNPADYKGKTIIFGATIDPKNDESGPVVKNFEEKYGIKVDIRLYHQNSFAQQVQKDIAAGNSADVVRVNGDFPTCMGYLQSLEAAKLNYEEDFWNQKMFEISTFGGSPYLCDSKNNIWSEIDICVYSKSLLKRAGANTPEEYDKAGKWTWDAYFDIARKVKALPGFENGCSFLSRENAIYGMGGGLINYDYSTHTFTSGVNQRTQEAMVKFCTAWKEGLISWSGTTDLSQGKIGITTTPAWVLKKTGAFQNTGMNMSDLGFYYLPRWDASSDYGNTGMIRGWGLVRGAKEPVAAGIFMREYLDVNNYDVSSTFISPEAEEFFFRITSINYDNWNPQIIYMDYNDGIAGSSVSTSEFYMAMSEDPAQVGTVMASVKGTMQKAADNINKFVKQNTGIR